MASIAASVPAFAHGFAGNRFFPATLATDDPFVADELSLPTFQAIRQPGSPPAKTFDLSADVAFRLTPNFGVGAGEGYQFQKSPGSRLQTGFTNVAVSGKYQFFVSAEHETILSVAALKAGKYKVVRRVVSVDTHTTSGTFGFEIVP